ncbi:MAG TPA: ABC transporter substrate-binding protein [Rhodocyclaceae bacterium]|nr:ABC transporter substrate-binding protein [Rhodocyclaceae bacterium]
MRAFRLLPFFLLVAVIGIFLWRDAPKPKEVAPRHIAIAQLTAVDDETVSGFREAMAELGYREGREVVYSTTGAIGSVSRVEDALQANLKTNPDLLLVSSTPVAQAAKRLTDGQGRPPVIFAPVNDPLGAGVVPDLRRPGGHITGIRLPRGDDLRLKWLVQIVPKARRIYVPYSLDDKSALASLQHISEAAARLGVTLLPQPFLEEDDMAARIAAMPMGIDAVFLPRDSRIEAHIAEFVALAEKRRLPISAPSLTQVRAGALFSYGFVHREIGRQAARLADQILKGTRPGDLPVEMAESRLAINLAAADRIGITIPDEILLQAEYVIRK